MKNLFCYLLILMSINLFGQKKVLDHPEFDIWNSIQRSSISANGDFIIYSIVKGEKDSQLKIKNNKGDLVFEYNHDATESEVESQFFSNSFSFFNLFDGIHKFFSLKLSNFVVRCKSEFIDLIRCPKISVAFNAKK